MRVGKVIAGQLEEAAWITEPVDFIQNDPSALMPPQERFVIFRIAPYQGDIAVEGDHIFQRESQSCLT